MLARRVAEADADDDERERDALRSEKSVSNNRPRRKRKPAYDDGLEGVKTDILCVRSGDVRGEEGDQRGRVQRGRLNDRLEDAPAFAQVILLDFVI